MTASDTVTSLDSRSDWYIETLSPGLPLFVDQLNVALHRRVQRVQEQTPILRQIGSHFRAGLRQLATATSEVSVIEMVEAYCGVYQCLQKNTVWFAIA